MDGTPQLATAEILRAIAGFAIAAFGLLLVATLLLAPFGFAVFVVGCVIAGKPRVRAFEIAHEQSEADAQKGIVDAAVGQVRFDGADWVEAGSVVVDDAGRPQFPELPGVAGIRRLDFVGPDANLYAIAIAHAQDLRETVCNDGSDDDRRAIAEMMAHVLAGGSIAVSYIDRVCAGRTHFDLSDEENRQAVVDVLHRQATAHGAWNAGVQ